jgi:hypothetical protein
MALATVLAIVLTAVRWYLWRRSRRAARDPAWPVPAPGTARRARAGGRTFAESGYPAGFGDPGSTRVAGGPGVSGAPRAPGAPGAPGASGAWSDPRPGPRPGSEPYNFSSGA